MSQNSFLFDKTNYLLFAVGLALIVLGFILMAGAARKIPTYTTRRFLTRDASPGRRS